MKNFIDIVDCIFVNKDRYDELTDEEKTNAFFIINKKFAKKYPKAAYFFNNKNVDKPSAIDQWFEIFKNQHGIPAWYWTTKSKKDTPKVKKDKDYDKIAERYELKKDELKFLIQFYKKDLDKDLKQIKMYEEEK